MLPQREDAQPIQRWGVSLDRRGGGESGWRTQTLGSPAFLMASLVLCTRWGSLHLPEYSHQAHVTPPTPSTLPRTHTHTSHDTHPETRHTPSQRLHTQTRTYLSPSHRHQTTHTTDTQRLTPQIHTLHHAHTSHTPLKSHTPPRPQKHTPLTSRTPQFKSCKYLKSFYMHVYQ